MSKSIPTVKRWLCRIISEPNSREIDRCLVLAPNKRFARWEAQERFLSSLGAALYCKADKILISVCPETWFCEVRDRTGNREDHNYASSALRFKTKAEAASYARDLFCRWTASYDLRIVEEKSSEQIQIVKDGAYV